MKSGIPSLHGQQRVPVCRAAELLVQAAREKTGATQAEITLGAAQSIFPAEGRPADYGMIRFLGESFDVSESYMGLMLDETGQA